MGDKSKAFTLIMAVAIIASTLSFGAWKDLEATKEQEKTKRMISYDKRCARDLTCKPMTAVK